MTHYTKNNLPHGGHKSARKIAPNHPVRVRHVHIKEMHPELQSEEEEYYLELQSRLPC